MKDPAFSNIIYQTKKVTKKKIKRTKINIEPS